MKKVLALFLIVLYSSTSFGITMHMHYCCGKLDKVSFFSKIAEECKFHATSINSKGCCDNKTLTFNLKADQELHFYQPPSISQQHCLPLYAQAYNILLVNHHISTAPAISPPLIICSVPLFIQHCVYRI